MFSDLRKTLCMVLSWVMVLPSALSAQQAAPIPPQLLKAHAVFIANGGGSNYFDQFGGGPNCAYNTFYSQMKKMGQYELVDSPSQADAIFEIRAIAPGAGDATDLTFNPQVVLTVRDPKSNATLWTEKANVRAFGTKRHRDRGFDQSVAVLVDELAQVTGQPLTAAQTKAIDSNSKMPKGMKVLIISSVAAATAGISWGIYEGTHQPNMTLPNPPPPTGPGFPAGVQ